jgi:hypothetical protein
MKRSIRAVTTSESIREQAGCGTEPRSSTAAFARDANPGPNDRKIHAS